MASYIKKKLRDLLGVDVAKVRTCLKCGREFKSRGSGNRICWRCSEKNEGLSLSKVYSLVFGTGTKGED